MFLDAYKREFPEVRFVQTRRDVAQVLPSVADLYSTMLSAGNDVDPKYVGELNLEQWQTALNRLQAFRDDARRDAKFFDIGFTAFQSDPIAEIRRLYDWLGDEPTSTTTERMWAWRSDNPANKYGKHEYDAGQFGITDVVLAERFGIDRRRFGEIFVTDRSS